MTNSKPELLLSRLKPNTIYPPFLDKCKLLVENCANLGFSYWGVSGLRTFTEQQLIYAQGRTIPCSQCTSRGVKAPCGHIVSRAKPGFSPHQYGIAIDFCLDGDIQKYGLQPNWDVKAYEILAVEAEKLGLEAGAHWKSFKDAPHIQLPLGKYKITWTKLIAIYNQGGLNSVWKFLDGFVW